MASQFPENREDTKKKAGWWLEECIGERVGLMTYTWHSNKEKALFSAKQQRFTHAGFVRYMNIYHVGKYGDIKWEQAA